MLVKKSSLNQTNKEGTFTQGFKDWRKMKGKFRGPWNSADKVNCFKASAENAWLLHRFQFSLNPGDKPNVAQT